MALKFHADDYLAKNQSGICSYINDISAEKHSHDYYEIFLIEEGVAAHIVNSTKINVFPGTLCVIRPDDIHYFTSDHCNMYNVLLRREVWEGLTMFLGRNQIVEDIMSSALPIHINLNPDDFASASRLLENNILTPHISTEEYNTHIKTVAVSLLGKYFEYPATQANTLRPAWLDRLLNEMQSPDNYLEGLDAMHRISGYSPEHLCRTFKRELGVTPTEYLNTIRVRAASKYLVYSDDQIIDISSKCGFNTLSHFYHQFKKNYGCSPYQYKKAHKLQMSPKGFEPKEST